jgi:hypothetical protein
MNATENAKGDRAKWHRVCPRIVTRQADVSRWRGVQQSISQFSWILVVIASVFLAGVSVLAQENDVAQVDIESETSVDRSLPMDGAGGRELLLRNFRPQSKLRVPETLLTKAMHPVVDVHTHFHHRLRGNQQALDDFVALMDRNQIAVCASLDGKLGDQLSEHRKYLWTNYRDRFVIFANVDWQGDGEKDDPSTWSCHRQGFADRTADQLSEAAKNGVSGLKVFKRFGLQYRNPDGSLIRIDDSRWDPIWKRCGELGIPVIIHTADPAAFFDPIDATNERWEELSRHPDWSFHGEEFPSRMQLLEARTPANAIYWRSRG